MTINVDKVPGLQDIDTIKHFRETLLLKWNRELFINQV
jgi:hypothetical protein